MEYNLECTRADLSYGVGKAGFEIWSLKRVKTATRLTRQINLSTLNMVLRERCHCGSVRFEVDETAIVDVVCNCPACKIVPPNYSES